MRQHVRDEESQDVLDGSTIFAWRHVARRFHPPTKQWAGPAQPLLLDAAASRRPGRSSSGPSTHGRSSNSCRRPRPGRAWTPTGSSWTARPSLVCRLHDAAGPRDGDRGLRPQRPRASTTSSARRTCTRTSPWAASISATCGTSGARCWPTGRPPTGPAAVRLRCLHDDYDYSSASLFTIQDRTDMLGAVLFATDRGDTHISLDKIANATIPARDLRLRLQFEGAVDDLTHPRQAGARRADPLRLGPDRGRVLHPRRQVRRPARASRSPPGSGAGLDRPRPLSRSGAPVRLQPDRRSGDRLHALPRAQGLLVCVCGSLGLREHRRPTHRPRNRFAAAGMVVPETQQPDVVSDHSHETIADAAAERGLLREDGRPGPVEILTSVRSSAFTRVKTVRPALRYPEVMGKEPGGAEKLSTRLKAGLQTG